MPPRRNDGGPQGTATEKSTTPEPSDGATADESSEDGQVGQSDGLIFGDPCRDIIDFMCAVYGTAQGWVGVSFGIEPYRNAKGKIGFRHWMEGFGRWPDDALALLDLLVDSLPYFDSYLGGNLLTAPRRSKGNAIGLTPHADVDGGRLDVGKVRAGPFWAVNSGTPGNGHVYAPLTREVPAHQYEMLCRGMMAHFGAADAKIAPNDVLRVPRSWNRKPTVDRGDPVPVTWAVRPTGDRVDPEELAEFLGVELTDEPLARQPKTKRHSASSRAAACSGEIEQFNLSWYWRVRRAMDLHTGDRSQDTARIVGACHDAGLNERNARWAVRHRADLAERLDERSDDDIARCWERISASRPDPNTIKRLRRAQP